MTGDLLTFPIRLGLRAARIAARTGLQASERAISVASFVVKRATSSGSHGDRPADSAAHAATEQRAPAQRERTPATSSPERTRGPVQTAQVSPIPRATAPVPPSPGSETVHVSEEPTLVESFAEPGAENGAGAQVSVAEPWDGYAHMSAKDVVTRMSDANAVELAAVQLYESAHRGRETVITAVQRELRAKSGRGAAIADQTRKEHTNGE